MAESHTPNGDQGIKHRRHDKTANSRSCQTPTYRSLSTNTPSRLGDSNPPPTQAHLAQPHLLQNVQSLSAHAELPMRRVRGLNAPKNLTVDTKYFKQAPLASYIQPAHFAWAHLPLHESNPKSADNHRQLYDFHQSNAAIAARHSHWKIYCVRR